MAAPDPDAPTGSRLWVGMVTPQEVVARGLKGLLEDALGSAVLTSEGQFIDGEPDVLLYDVMGLHEGDGSDLDYWVKETGTTVIAVVHELRPDLGAMALERGAEGAISIGATAEDLLEVIRAAMSGGLDESPAAQYAEESTHLGSDAGLSERETDVLRLIAQGISNQEIAEALFLSVNSVKTYIRSTYHKINVASRAQAVAWAMKHGFPPDSASTEGDGLHQSR